MKKIHVLISVFVALFAAFILIQPSRALDGNELSAASLSAGGRDHQTYLSELPPSTLSFPAWYDLAWSYRLPVVIDNGGAALTDYAVMVRLDGSFDFVHAQADGADLRVTGSDGVSELDFWVESWDGAGQLAYVWVEVGNIPAGTSEIFLYYGNPAATSVGDGAATFSFFDDTWCQFPGSEGPGCGASNPVQTATQGWWETYTTYPMVFEDTSFAGRPQYHMLYDGHGVIGHAKGYATSPDLNTWTEYDGGAPHPPNPNPIMAQPAGYPGAGAQYAWGDTIKVGGTYYMFVSRGPGTCQRVESTDLITWTNFTYLVDDDPGGVIGSGVAVLKEPDGITPIQVNGEYWMVYYRGGSPGTMYMAHSTDLLNWSYTGSAFLPPTPGGFDAAGLWTPSFIRFGDMYYIYYQGQASGGVWETGYARASAYSGGNPLPPDPGSTAWSKSDTNGDGIPDSVLKRGPAGSWDSTEAIDPMVRQFSDGVYYLFYTGNQNNGYATASAPEGPWTKLGEGMGVKWTPAGSPTVVGGVLTLNAGVGITSIGTFQNNAVGYRASYGVGNGLQWGGYINGSQGMRTMVGSVTGQSTQLYLKNYQASEVTALLCDGCRGAYHEFEVLWRSGTSEAVLDHGAARATLNTQVPGSALPVTFYSYTGSGATTQVDWVYVRPYRYPEPGAGLGVEQGMVDLSIGKTGEPDVVRVGEALTYTVVVTNQGEVSVGGVVMTDTLPGGVSLVSVEAEQGSCEGTGVVVCTLGEVLDRVQVTLVVTSSVAGEITNVAEVSSSSYELTPGDNLASAVTTVLPAADLSISQVDDPDPVLSGHLVTYILTVRNAGLSASAGIILTDVLPANFTFISAEPSAYCSQTEPVVCSLPGLPALGSSVVQVVGMATLDGLITNTVTVASSTYDPNLANNSSEESTVVVTNADLSVTQTDTPDPVLVEQALTYTLSIHNAGPSIGANTRLTDTLPGGATLVSVSTDQGNCIAGSVVTCALGNLASGAGVHVEIVVLPLTEGSITNKAEVVMETPEDDLGNNTSTESTTVLPMSADLDLTYTAPLTAIAGETLVYSAQVVNRGPSRAISPSVTINLPSGVTYLISTPGAPACTETGGIVTCQVDEIVSGGTFGISVLVQVDPAVPYGTEIGSQAAVTSVVADPVPGNNNMNVKTTVYTLADLGIEIFEDRDPVAPDTYLTYTLVINNYGPSDAIGLIVTDTLPSQVDFKLATPNICYQKPYTYLLICEPSDLAAGQATQIKLKVQVKMGVTLPIQNHVTISTITPDPDTANNVVDVSTNIDFTPPSLEWVAPVKDELTPYLVFPRSGLTVTLIVTATDDIAVDYVTFVLWDHSRNAWVNLCVDREGSSKHEYECTWVFDNSLVLLDGLNQLYAYAHDTAGNVTGKRIWILNRYLLLPMIMK